VKRILLASNVVLNVFLDREPHYEASAALFDAIKAGSAEGFVSAHAVTTIHYLIARESDRLAARRTLTRLLGAFRVAPVDQAVIDAAFELPFADFEDAVTAAAARAARCDLIATRDPKGFRGSPVRALQPEAIVALLVV
jgi:predicted nucleic acid-binding protein